MLRGHAPAASFDHTMDDGASARYLAEKLESEYIDRKAPPRRAPAASSRRAPPPRDVYYARGGGDRASCTTPNGGDLRYDENGPSSLRRSVPESVPGDVGGWSRGERSHDPRPEPVDYLSGEG